MLRITKPFSFFLGLSVAAVSAEKVLPDRKSQPSRKRSNRFVHEKTHCLQQHAKNPVHFYMNVVQADDAGL